jgi:hypothetical protein
MNESFLEWFVICLVPASLLLSMQQEAESGRSYSLEGHMRHNTCDDIYFRQCGGCADGKNGYHRILSAGAVRSVGTLGDLIPQSISLIIGIMTQQSIGKSFLGGLVSGLEVKIIIGWCVVEGFSSKEKTRLG